MAVDRMIQGIWAGPAQPGWKVSVAQDAPEDAPPAEPFAEADDRALVEACLRGHREAFDVIVQRHQRQVYQLCYRFVGNHEDASDLAQDVFIRAYRGLKNFKKEASLGTWLYRFGVNVCLNKVASKAPKPESLEPLLMASDERVTSRGESAGDAVLREERAEQVRAAIAKLPKKQRTTLILRVYHELPHDEIAKIV